MRPKTDARRSAKTRPYDSWRLEKLSDPRLDAIYRNAAMGDSNAMFLNALKNVSQ